MDDSQDISCQDSGRPLEINGFESENDFPFQIAAFLGHHDPAPHGPPHHDPASHELPRHKPPRHDSARREPPRYKPPRHRKSLGLNSLLSEALEELAPTFSDVHAIEAVVQELDKDLLPLFARVSAEGITKPVEFVKRFLEIEASERTNIRNLMLSDAKQNLAIALFPLPPYIAELLRPVLAKEFSFNTTEHVPVHIRKDNIQSLGYDEYLRLFGGTHSINALILDGQRFSRLLVMRSNAASLLQLLLSKSLKRIYLHKIPHIPHREKFVTFDLSNYGLEMYNI